MSTQPSQYSKPGVVRKATEVPEAGAAMGLGSWEQTPKVRQGLRAINPEPLPPPGITVADLADTMRQIAATIS